MPRSGPSLADRGLLAAAAAAGFPVSPTQLERWRALGLVPRNVRRGRGRGRGTTSEVPPDALPQLLRVASAARQGRALVPEPVFTRLLAGMRVSDDEVRTAVARQLRRFMRSRGLDRSGDAGWQTRYERVRRTVRGSRRGWRPPLTLTELLAGQREPVLTEEEGRARREAALVYAHAFAGDVDGFSGEEWARASTAVNDKRTAAEVDQTVAEVRAQELAGIDPVAQVVGMIAFPRLLEVVAALDVAQLRRAIIVLKLVDGGHAALAVQQFHARIRREVPRAADWDHHLPPLLRRDPDLERLRAHPLWETFGQGASPTEQHANALVAALAVVLAGDLERLDEVEDYLDLLCDVTGMQR